MQSVTEIKQFDSILVSFSQASTCINSFPSFFCAFILCLRILYLIVKKRNFILQFFDFYLQLSFILTKVLCINKIRNPLLISILCSKTFSPHNHERYSSVSLLELRLDILSSLGIL